MMAILDVPLALVVALAFPAMLLLMRWFSRHSAVAYRRTRETIAALIVHFVETVQRDPRGEGVPPRAAQRGDLRAAEQRVPRPPTPAR